MRHLLVALAALGLLAGGLAAEPTQEREKPPQTVGKQAEAPGQTGENLRKATPEQISEEIRALQQRLKDLEREQDQAERRRAEQEWFDDLQQRGRDRLRECNDRLMELMEEGEPEGEARKRARAAQKQHVENVRAAAEKICALKGVESLPDAVGLSGQLELIDTEYDMVTEPGLSMAAELEDLSQRAAEVGDEQSEAAIENLRKLHAEATELGRRQFDLWKRRRQLDTQMWDLADKLRDRLDSAARGAEGGK